MAGGHWENRTRTVYTYGYAMTVTEKVWVPDTSSGTKPVKPPKDVKRTPAGVSAAVKAAQARAKDLAAEAAARKRQADARKATYDGLMSRTQQILRDPKQLADWLKSGAEPPMTPQQQKTLAARNRDLRRMGEQPLTSMPLNDEQRRLQQIKNERDKWAGKAEFWRLRQQRAAWEAIINPPKAPKAPKGPGKPKVPNTTPAKRLHDLEKVLAEMRNEQKKSNGAQFDPALFNKAYDAYAAEVEKFKADYNRKMTKFTDLFKTNKKGELLKDAKGKLIAKSPENLRKATNMWKSAEFQAYLKAHDILFGKKPGDTGTAYDAYGVSEEIANAQRDYLKGIERSYFQSQRNRMYREALAEKDPAVRDQMLAAAKEYSDRYINPQNLTRRQIHRVIGRDSDGKPILDPVVDTMTVEEEIAAREQEDQWKWKAEWKARVDAEQAKRRAGIFLRQHKPGTQPTVTVWVNNNGQPAPLEMSREQAWLFNTAAHAGIPVNDFGMPVAKTKQDIERIIGQAMQVWDKENAGRFGNPTVYKPDSPYAAMNMAYLDPNKINNPSAELMAAEREAFEKKLWLLFGMEKPSWVEKAPILHQLNALSGMFGGAGRMMATLAAGKPAQFVWADRNYQVDDLPPEIQSAVKKKAAELAKDKDFIAAATPGYKSDRPFDEYIAEMALSSALDVEAKQWLRDTDEGKTWANEKGLLYKSIGITTGRNAAETDKIQAETLATYEAIYGKHGQEDKFGPGLQNPFAGLARDPGEAFDVAADIGTRPFTEDSWQANLAFNMFFDPSNVVPLKFTTWAARAAFAMESVQNTSRLARIGKVPKIWLTVTEDELRLRKFVKEGLSEAAKGGEAATTRALLLAMRGVKKNELKGALLAVAKALKIETDPQSIHQMMSLVESDTLLRLRGQGHDLRARIDEVGASLDEAERIAKEMVEKEAKRNEEILAAAAKREQDARDAAKAARERTREAHAEDIAAAEADLAKAEKEVAEATAARAAAQAAKKADDKKVAEAAARVDRKPVASPVTEVVDNPTAARTAQPLDRESIIEISSDRTVERARREHGVYTPTYDLHRDVNGFFYPKTIEGKAFLESDQFRELQVKAASDNPVDAAFAKAELYQKSRELQRKQSQFEEGWTDGRIRGPDRFDTDENGKPVKIGDVPDTTPLAPDYGETVARMGTSSMVHEGLNMADRQTIESLRKRLTVARDRVNTAIKKGESRSAIRAAQDELDAVEEEVGRHFYVRRHLYDIEADFRELNGWIREYDSDAAYRILEDGNTEAAVIPIGQMLVDEARFAANGRIGAVMEHNPFDDMYETLSLWDKDAYGVGARSYFNTKMMEKIRDSQWRRSMTKRQFGRMMQTLREYVTTPQGFRLAAQHLYEMYWRSVMAGDMVVLDHMNQLMEEVLRRDPDDVLANTWRLIEARGGYAYAVPHVVAEEGFTAAILRHNIIASNDALRAAREASLALSPAARQRIRVIEVAEKKLREMIDVEKRAQSPNDAKITRMQNGLIDLDAEKRALRESTELRVRATTGGIHPYLAMGMIGFSPRSRRIPHRFGLTSNMKNFDRTQSVYFQPAGANYTEDTALNSLDAMVEVPLATRTYQSVRRAGASQSVYAWVVEANRMVHYLVNRLGDPIRAGRIMTRAKDNFLFVMSRGVGDVATAAWADFKALAIEQILEPRIAAIMADEGLPMERRMMKAAEERTKFMDMIQPASLYKPGRGGNLLHHTFDQSVRNLMFDGPKSYYWSGKMKGINSPGFHTFHFVTAISDHTLLGKKWVPFARRYFEYMADIGAGAEAKHIISVYFSDRLERIRKNAYEWIYGGRGLGKPLQKQWDVKGLLDGEEGAVRRTIVPPEELALFDDLGLLPEPDWVAQAEMGRRLQRMVDDTEQKLGFHGDESAIEKDVLTGEKVELDGADNILDRTFDNPMREDRANIGLWLEDTMQGMSDRVSAASDRLIIARDDLLVFEKAGREQLNAWMEQYKVYKKMRREEGVPKANAWLQTIPETDRLYIQKRWLYDQAEYGVRASIESAAVRISELHFIDQFSEDSIREIAETIDTLPRQQRDRILDGWDEVVTYWEKMKNGRSRQVTRRVHHDGVMDRVGGAMFTSRILQYAEHQDYFSRVESLVETLRGGRQTAAAAEAARVHHINVSSITGKSKPIETVDEMRGADGALKPAYRDLNNRRIAYLNELRRYEKPSGEVFNSPTARTRHTEAQKRLEAFLRENPEANILHRAAMTDESLRTMQPVARDAVDESRLRDLNLGQVSPQPQRPRKPKPAEAEPAAAPFASRWGSRSGQSRVDAVPETVMQPRTPAMDTYGHHFDIPDYKAHGGRSPEGDASVYLQINYPGGIPHHGPKIHLSIGPNQMDAAIPIVDRIARAYGLTYKYIFQRDFMLAPVDQLTGKIRGKHTMQDGKSFALYLDESNAREIVEELGARLEEAGIKPWENVPNDRQVGNSPIFYRWSSVYSPRTAEEAAIDNAERAAADGAFKPGQFDPLVGLGRDGAPPKTPPPGVRFTRTSATDDEIREAAERARIESEAAPIDEVTADPLPGGPTPDVAAMQTVLDALKGMSEEQYLTSLEARMRRILSDRTASAEQKAGARARLDDIDKARLVIRVERVGGSYIPFESRNAFASKVKSLYAARAAAVFAHRRVGPYVTGVRGSLAEQGRALFRYRQTHEVALAGKVGPIEDVSMTYQRHGDALDAAMASKVPARLWESLGIDPALAGELSVLEFLTNMEEFKFLSQWGDFQRFTASLRGSAEKYLRRLSNDRTYTLDQYLHDRIMTRGGHYDALEFEQHDILISRMRQRITKGQKRQSLTDNLRAGRKEGDPTKEPRAEMLERNIASIIAKSKVAAEHGIDVHRYNEARKVLREPMLQKRMSMSWAKKAHAYAISKGHVPGTKAYTKAYDEEYLRIRALRAEKEAAQKLYDLARTEGMGMQPDEVIDLFEKRALNLDGEIRDIPAAPITPFQAATLDEAIKTFMGVTDPTDFTQIAERLREAGQMPPFHDRTLMREWLVHHGFWTPRRAEQIADGRKSWSLAEQAKFYRDNYGYVPEWADPAAYAPGGPRSHLRYDETAFYEQMRKDGLFNARYEIRSDGATRSQVINDTLYGNEDLGIKPVRDIGLQRRYVAETFGDLAVGADGHFHAFPWLMDMDEYKTFLNTKAENLVIGENLIRDEKQLEAFRVAMKKAQDALWDTHFAAGKDVTWDDVFRFSVDVVTELLEHPSYLSKPWLGNFFRWQAKMRRYIIFAHPAFGITNAVDSQVKYALQAWNLRAFRRPGMSKRAQSLTLYDVGRRMPSTMWHDLQRAPHLRVAHPEGWKDFAGGVVGLSPELASTAENATFLRLIKENYDGVFEEISKKVDDPELADAMTLKFLSDRISAAWPTKGDNVVENVLNTLVPFFSYHIKNRLFFLSQAASHPAFLLHWEDLGNALEIWNLQQWEQTHGPEEPMPWNMRRLIVTPWGTFDLSTMSDASRGLDAFYAIDTSGNRKVTMQELVGMFIHTKDVTTEALVAALVNHAGIWKQSVTLKEYDETGFWTGKYITEERGWSLPWDQDTEANITNAFWPAELLKGFGDALFGPKIDGTALVQTISRMLTFGGLKPYDKAQAYNQFFMALKDSDPEAAKAWLAKDGPEQRALRAWWDAKKTNPVDFVIPEGVQGRYDPFARWHAHTPEWQTKLKVARAGLKGIRDRGNMNLWDLTPGTPEYSMEKKRIRAEIMAYYAANPVLYEAEVEEMSPFEWATKMDGFILEQQVDMFFAMQDERPKMSQFKTAAEYLAAKDAFDKRMQQYLLAHPAVAQKIGLDRNAVETFWEDREKEWAEVLDRVGRREVALEAAREAEDWRLVEMLYRAQELDFSKLEEESATQYFTPDDIVQLDKGQYGPEAPRYAGLLPRIKVFNDFDAARLRWMNDEEKKRYEDKRYYGEGMKAAIAYAKEKGKFDPARFVKYLKDDPRLLKMYFDEHPGKQEEWRQNEKYMKVIGRFGKLAQAGRWNEAWNYFNSMPDWAKIKYYMNNGKTKKQALQELEYRDWMGRWVAHYKRRDYAGGARFYAKMPEWVRKRYEAKNGGGPGRGSSPYSRAMGKWVGLLKAGKKDEAKRYFDSLPKAYKERYYANHPEAALRDNVRRSGQLAEYFLADDSARAEYLRDNPGFAKWLRSQGNKSTTRTMLIMAAYQALPDDPWAKRVFREKYPEVFSQEAKGEARLQKTWQFLAQHPEMTPAFKKWLEAVYATYADSLRNTGARPKPLVMEHRSPHTMNRKRPHGGQSAEWVRIHTTG